MTGAHAVVTGIGNPYRIHRAELGAGPITTGPTTTGPAVDLGTPAASTHGLGIPDAIQLAGVLGRAPARLVVFAVEAADLGFGTSLSPAMAACLPGLTRAVLAELGPAGRYQQPAHSGYSGRSLRRSL